MKKLSKECWLFDEEDIFIMMETKSLASCSIEMAFREIMLFSLQVIQLDLEIPVELELIPGLTVSQLP